MDVNKNNTSSEITLRTRILLPLHIVLAAVALVISTWGITSALNAPLRLCIYISQAAMCVVIIIYGLMHLKNTEAKHFQRIIYCYALIEILRCSLLGTNGIPLLAGIAARAVLATLACNCVLMTQRLNSASSAYIAISIASLETLLYLIFFFFFPGVRSSVLLTLLPLVGILIAVSLFLFNVVRLGRKIS